MRLGRERTSFGFFLPYPTLTLTREAAPFLPARPKVGVHVVVGVEDVERLHLALAPRLLARLGQLVLGQDQILGVAPALRRGHRELGAADVRRAHARRRLPLRQDALVALSREGSGKSEERRRGRAPPAAVSKTRPHLGVDHHLQADEGGVAALGAELAVERLLPREAAGAAKDL